MNVLNIKMRDETGKHCFTISVIGLETSDLLTIPSQVSSTLAARYPFHRPTILDISHVPPRRLQPR